MSDSAATSSRIIVSFRVGLALAAANVLCAAIISWAWIKTRPTEEAVTVKGSASERIESDLIIWRSTVAADHTNLLEGYRLLKDGVEKATEYMRSQGIAATEITILPTRTTTKYTRDAKGQPTNTIESYDLRQTIEVASHNVLKVADVSRRSTELLEQGLLFESDAPEFIYTKLSDLKIKILAQATKDARVRAEQICNNSGGKLGVLRSARMGVMQITPEFSFDVSDYGCNDTSSYVKRAQAVLSAEFAVE